MAISFVGSIGGSAGGTDETVNFSSLLDEAGGTPTVQTGDIVIVTLCRRATSNTPPAVTTAGYASVYANVYSNSTDDPNLQSFYKVMGATPDTSVVITTTGFSNTQAYTVHVFRGVDTTTPFGGITPTTAATSGASGPDAPSITPTAAGSWICAAGGCSGSSGGNLTALTNPANMSATANHFATGTNVRAEVALALKTDWTSGAFDPAAFGGGGTTAGNGLSAATFVLKPAAGGSGVTGSLAATESGSDTASFTGSVEVSGSLAATDSGTDTAAISGTVKVQGSLSATESGSDTFAASGTVASAGITGTLAATDTGTDTASITGTVEVSGSLAATETGSDTFSATGSVTGGTEITGALAVIETGTDTAAFAGTVSTPAQPAGTWADLNNGTGSWAGKDSGHAGWTNADNASTSWGSDSSVPSPWTKTQNGTTNWS